MKTIIKYIVINRLFLVLMALFCTLLIPMIKIPIHRGNISPWVVEQGDHTYSYVEPKPMYQDMWSVWDSKWYISIAEDGYSKQKYPYKVIDNKGFMPLYPLLIWLISTFILFGHYHLGGFIISNIFLILSLYFLKKFIESDKQIKDKVNINNLYLYLLFFPTSYYLSSIYPESMFLFLSIFSLYLLNIKKIGWACLIIGLASITKIFGIFLLIPLFFTLFKERKNLSFKKIFYYGIITAITPSLYLLYMYIISGDALAYLNIQKMFFQHNWTNPIETILYDIFYRTSAQSLLHGTATLFGITIILLGYKKIKIEYILYSLTCILFTPFTGMVNGNARYLASLFFIPIILELILKDENKKMIIIHIMSFIQGLIFMWWLVGAGFTS